MGPGPRRFLGFSFLNTFSWQALVGSVLILHARALDLPPVAVGVLMSLTPFSMVLTLIAGPLSERVGPRRLMVIGWLLRYAAAAPLMLTPWIAAVWGPRGAGLALFAGVLSFCTIRALACVGWFPWLHEIIPGSERGRYFSLEMILVQVVNVVVGVGTFSLLGSRPEAWKFGITSAVGIAAGFASVLLILRIPGGGPARCSVGVPRGRNVRLVLRDRPFLRYVGWTSLGTFVTAGHSTLLTLAMRDSLGIAPAMIMLTTAVGAAAAMTAGPWWGRLADRHGTGPVQGLAGLALAIGLGGFGLLRSGTHPQAGAMVLFAVCAVGYCGFFVGSNRGMLQRMRPRVRAAYSAVWQSLTSIAAGTSHIVLGQVIQKGGDGGARAACVGYAVLIVLVGWRCAALPEAGMALREELRGLFQPARPFLSIARACWYLVNPPAEANGALPADPDRDEPA
ncbi:MAG: MFS transporter [Lentisphaeria bacterium]|nr:MFS transporter [Lentisphaeria bacterium]